MKAFLKNYRQSPRKVRLVADLIRGKDVIIAVTLLNFLPKRAGFPIKKLLEGAIANAIQMGFSKDNLVVKEIAVDKGIVMKRMMPAAMGTGHRINKRTSHINILLAEKGAKATSKKVLNKKENTKKEINTEDKLKENKKKVVKKTKTAKIK